MHKFFQNGVYIVLDVNSGSVHVVDKIVFDLLDNAESGDESELREARAEIRELEENGALFSPEPDIKLPAGGLVKALCLHVSHDCNMNCAYCFAEAGKFQSGRRSLMPLETGKKALDFLVARSGGRKNLEIDFFGGEPLMNFEVVKGIVRYGRELEKIHNKTFRFTITTNGLLLDAEKQDYILQNMFNVVLSIDGRKEVNDAMRRDFSGAGTYEKIVPKFIEFAKKRGGGNYYARGTFTRQNLDFTNDVLHLAELGFKNISVEPVVSDGADSIRPEDLPAVFAEYERLAKILLENPINFFHFNIDLSGGPCAAKRAAGCGAGSEYLAVTPEGDLYPCHQFVGNKKFFLGNIDQPELAPAPAQLGIFKEDCAKCWAKFFCSGGCMANAYNSSGDLGEPYKVGCELMKKRIECALMIAAKRSL